MAKKELIDIAAELHHETASAYLIWDGRVETKDNQIKVPVKVWVPKSQAEYSDGIITMPLWLAEEKGFI